MNDDPNILHETARRMAAAHVRIFGEPKPHTNHRRPALMVQNQHGEFFAIIEDDTGIIRIIPVTPK